jgi:hypothetical protein
MMAVMGVRISRLTFSSSSTRALRAVSAPAFAFSTAVRSSSLAGAGRHESSAPPVGAPSASAFGVDRTCCGTTTDSGGSARRKTARR